MNSGKPKRAGLLSSIQPSPPKKLPLTWGWTEENWAEWEAEKAKVQEQAGTYILNGEGEIAPAQEEEITVQAASRGRLKISRVIHARHPNGKTCVVSGPFPDGFFRSDTRKTVAEVLKFRSSSLFNHESTERDDRYALVLTSDVVEILSGENEFGEVSP